jgi:hypothetical protein
MDPSYSPGTPPVPSTPGVRDASHVRPDEIMPSRSVSSPVLHLPEIPAAAFDDARTVPTPPAEHTQTIKHLSSAPIETRPLVSYSEPTPKPGVVRPVTAAAAPPPPPPQPAAQAARPPQAQPRLPGSHPGKSVLPPLRSSSHGGSAHLPPTASRQPAPPAPSTRPPSAAGIELPKLRSFHAVNPALSADLILPTSSAAPRPFSAEAPRPLSAESFRVPLSSSGPAVTLAPAAPIVPSRLPSTPSGPPTYQPPTVIPFFEQAVETPPPGLFQRLVRWVFMLLVATAIGAALGYAIWFNYLRSGH